MQENDFEKQVRQLMGDMNLTPSEPVWTAVERRIQKKERRRRGIFLLFFLTALLTGGYFLYQNSLKSKESSAVKSILPPNKKTYAVNDTAISKTTRPASESVNKNQKGKQDVASLIKSPNALQPAETQNNTGFLKNEPENNVIAEPLTIVKNKDNEKPFKALNDDEKEIKKTIADEKNDSVTGLTLNIPLHDYEAKKDSSLSEFKSVDSSLEAANEQEKKRIKLKEKKNGREAFPFFTEAPI